MHAARAGAAVSSPADAKISAHYRMPTTAVAELRSGIVVNDRNNCSPRCRQTYRLVPVERHHVPLRT
jgi:hypothetical protein